MRLRQHRPTHHTDNHERKQAEARGAHRIQQVPQPNATRALLSAGNARLGEHIRRSWLAVIRAINGKFKARREDAS